MKAKKCVIINDFDHFVDERAMGIAPGIYVQRTGNSALDAAIVSTELRSMIQEDAGVDLD